ncbi:STAS domain-containing protein [Nonomuraea sp. NPDC050547]|uniref:STAS domain-containing protein n=1 Tax=Nonomuraea sp. NPDC050547 TaxID=3364368 RepID=UPI0037BC40B5
MRRADIATAHAFEEAVEAAVGQTRGPHLILDLSELTFMDSLGLRSVPACHRQARARDGQLTLVNPAPQIAHLLSVTMLDRHIPIFATIDQAIT